VQTHDRPTELAEYTPPWNKIPRQTGRRRNIIIHFLQVGDFHSIMVWNTHTFTVTVTGGSSNQLIATVRNVAAVTMLIWPHCLLLIKHLKHSFPTEAESICFATSVEVYRMWTYAAVTNSVTFEVLPCVYPGVPCNLAVPTVTSLEEFHASLFSFPCSIFSPQLKGTSCCTSAVVTFRVSASFQSQPHDCFTMYKSNHFKILVIF